MPHAISIVGFVGSVEAWLLTPAPFVHGSTP